MGNKKQTAVEFLHSEYKRIFGSSPVTHDMVMELSDSLAKAKQNEKRQKDKFAIQFTKWIIKNCNHERLEYLNLNQLLEIYKNETYGNKD